jgi:hypothetical protein
MPIDPERLARHQREYASNPRYAATSDMIDRHFGRLLQAHQAQLARSQNPADAQEKRPAIPQVLKAPRPQPRRHRKRVKHPDQ